jgi:hypothetical protein
MGGEYGVFDFDDSLGVSSVELVSWDEMDAMWFSTDLHTAI